MNNPNQTGDDRALSIKQAAERASLSPRTMWRLIETAHQIRPSISAPPQIIMASELSRHLSEGVS